MNVGPLHSRKEREGQSASDRYRRSLEKEKREDQEFRNIVGAASGARRSRARALGYLPALVWSLGAFMATVVIEGKKPTQMVLEFTLFVLLSVVLGAGAGAWVGEEDRRAGAISGAISTPLTAAGACYLFLREGGWDLQAFVVSSIVTVGLPVLIFLCLRGRVGGVPRR